MEYIEGGNLRGLADISRLETLLMARQTIQTLSYLHDQGITHRDIKPANILILSRGRGFNCKVADFGESSRESDLKTFCGTLLYTAPEIWNPPYSTPVDIWSLGIILVEFWYDWLPVTSTEFTGCPLSDSWLPDTAREGVPGVKTFQRSKLRELNSASQLIKLHDFIRRKLWEEMEEPDCSMAQILLHMLEDDPKRRYLASVCRFHLDLVSLPEYVILGRLY
jgi:serine/threonine protein kinase